MTTITRQFRFDAAHRVMGHEGKCKYLHGHQYFCEVTITAPELDKLGRVIDFSVVKEKIGSYIDKYWDHNTLLNAEDWELAQYIFENVNNQEKLPYTMPCNPTAENIANELWHISFNLLKPLDMDVVNVRVYETPNCWADYSHAQFRT